MIFNPVENIKTFVGVRASPAPLKAKAKVTDGNTASAPKQIILK